MNSNNPSPQKSEPKKNDSKKKTPIRQIKRKVSLR